MSDASTLILKALRSRPITRAPIYLFRAGLGFLMGPRLLLLEHLGRKSGESRYACLEVVERPDDNTVIIVSGLGSASQWYQNLLAQPRCRVSIGRRRRVRATARVLSAAEGDAVLERYQRDHPAAWKRLRGALEQAGVDTSSLPFLALTLHSTTPR